MSLYSPTFAGTHCAYPHRDGQAELTWVVSYIRRWFTRPLAPQTVRPARPSANVADAEQLLYCMVGLVYSFVNHVLRITIVMIFFQLQPEMTSYMRL